MPPLAASARSHDGVSHDRARHRTTSSNYSAENQGSAYGRSVGREHDWYYTSPQPGSYTSESPPYSSYNNYASPYSYSSEQQDSRYHDYKQGEQQQQLQTDYPSSGADSQQHEQPFIAWQSEPEQVPSDAASDPTYGHYYVSSKFRKAPSALPQYRPEDVTASRTREDVYREAPLKDPGTDRSSRRFSPGFVPETLRKKCFLVQPEAGHSYSKKEKQRYLTPAAHGGRHDVEFDFEKQKEFQNKLNKVLSNKTSFLKSSAASFAQFDTDGNQKLDFPEVRTLMAKLVQNLQLPPLDDRMLYRIFQNYQKKNSNYLTLSEFQTMYWELLHTIQSKFYPTRKTAIRRSTFVGRTTLERSDDIQKVFSFEKRLGAGSFGEVFLVRERASTFERVCKVINRDLTKVPVEQIEAEIDVLKKLDHPNIIKVFEVFQDQNSMYIIMEVCDGGELADRITKTFDGGYILTETYVADIMRQLLEAVNYFHTKRVAHKDLKPENVLFQSSAPDAAIKVIDFGLAEMFARQMEYSKNAAGTFYYMAPEVLDYIVTLKCDIWSAGCMLFLMLTGELPFPGQTIEEVEYKLRNSEPDYEKFRYLPVSHQAIDLIKRMLTRDLTKRPTAQECLDHPWLRTARSTDIKVPKTICANLKRFRRQPNLKNILTNLLAHQLNVTGHQIREINAVFRALDTDGNGHLSKKELAYGLSRVGIPPHEISQIVHALDIDGSETVSYTEFLAACYTWQEEEINLVWSAFNKMDRDGDGKITIEEFISCLTGESNNAQTFAPSVSESHVMSRIAADKEDLLRMIKEIDRNNDGVIDWKEFLSYMRHGF